MFDPATNPICAKLLELASLEHQHDRIKDARPRQPVRAGENLYRIDLESGGVVVDSVKLRMTSEGAYDVLEDALAWIERTSPR